MGMSGGGNTKSRMAMSEINVTPLVDVMLVLLIMFMVTAPLMQQGLEVEVPKTSASGVEPSEDPFRIIITADKRISVAKNPMPLRELQTKLKAVFEKRKNKQVYLEADARVDYGFVAEVMAEIRAAGIYSIGLITQPKSGP
jgi:biopolymer transport protein TolR